MKLIFRIKFLPIVLPLSKYGLAYNLNTNFIDYFYDLDQVTRFRKYISTWKSIEIKKL